jgi:hypothetical protein
MSMTTACVERALSEYLHAERDADNPALFHVHSGSGARYEVNVSGETPRCQCEYWHQHNEICKHILFIILMHPDVLNEVVR